MLAVRRPPKRREIALYLVPKRAFSICQQIQQQNDQLQLIFSVFKNEPGYNFLCNMIEIHTSYLYFPVVLLCGVSESYVV